jgi:hypothetical protein
MIQPLSWRFFILPIAVVIIFVALYWPAMAEVIGGRPKGCPHRFCGCALSLKLFGKIVPELNLAWNWAKKFPATQARVGAVAVRKGHVLQIIGGSPGQWTVWDANSGGGKIRIHQRNLARYRFVEPYSRYADNNHRDSRPVIGDSR